MKNKAFSFIKSALPQISNDDGGCIDAEQHPYEGFYLAPLLKAMKDSSWDFPSAMIALFPNMPTETTWELPMHPDESWLKLFQEFDKNITDLEFDT